MSTTTEILDVEEAEPTAEDALKSAFYVYSDAGLRLPPLPREMIPRLCNYADWHYGTQDVPPADRAALAEDAAAPETPDYLSFGHVGSGINNWSIALRMVLGPLAVFVRHPWGGAMGDREVDSVAVHKSFRDLEELIILAEQARQGGRIASGERLHVVQDSIQGGGWQILGRPGAAWQSAGDGIQSAIGALRQGAL